MTQRHIQKQNNQFHKSSKKLANTTLPTFPKRNSINYTELAYNSSLSQRINIYIISHKDVVQNFINFQHISLGGLSRSTQHMTQTPKKSCPKIYKIRKNILSAKQQSLDEQIHRFISWIHILQIRRYWRVICFFSFE